MKTKMTKHKMIRWAQPGDLETLQQAGWVIADSKPEVVNIIEAEEVINLKAPKTVKSKGTATLSLDNAIESKGD